MTEQPPRLPGRIRASRRDRLLAVFEKVLAAAAVACLGYLAAVVGLTALLDEYATRVLDAEARTNIAVRAVSTPLEARRTVDAGTPLGRLEIPAADVFSIIRAGDDAGTLRVGIGHISGTAWPGDLGNVGLAAHRDGAFHGLRHLQPGHTIRIVTPSARRDYVVSWTAVVEPDAVSVLDPTVDASLTLVTCYPFTYFGPAPQRFVVRAELITP